MSLTKTLGQFIADLSPNRLPEEAVRIARLGFIDCIGTMIAGRREDCVRIMKQVLAPADGPATLTFGKRKEHGAGSRLDQRHRGACARLRRRRTARPSQHRPGAGDPRRGGVAWLHRRRHDRGLCRRLRDLGRTVPPRYRPAAPEGLAPDGPVRRGRRRRGLRITAPARRRQGRAGDRARRLAKLRPDGEFRHDDEAVPRRQGGACRHHGGTPGRGRLHRQHRCAGTSAGLPARDLAHRHRGSHQRGQARRDLGDPDAGSRHQEVSHLLLHASRDRLHAGSGERDADQGRTR